MPTRHISLRETAISGVGLSATAAGRPVMEAPSIVCQYGTVHGLIGPSGSGKTTLLNCLGALTPLAGGTLTLRGEDARAWKEHRRLQFWREDAAFVFQDYGLVPDWTVTQNVFLTERKTAPNRKAQARLMDVLEEVGLAGREKTVVSALSGGEKQRVSIARALVKEARFIFADEPTASLDPANRDTVIRNLRLAAERGAVVVVATHDDAMIAACDETTRLEAPA